MSTNLKRVLERSSGGISLSFEHNDSTNVLELGNDSCYMDFPESEAIECLTTSNEALYAFMLNSNLNDNPDKESLKIYTAAFESILCAGGLSELIIDNNVSLESVSELRISMEKTLFKTEIAIEGLIDKVFNRISEFFGKFKIKLDEDMRRCEAIESIIKNKNNIPLHDTIKITDGNRLFINDKTTFDSMLQGFENIQKVTTSINTNLFSGLKRFIDESVKQIMNAYDGGDAASDVALMTVLVHLLGILSLFLLSSSMTERRNIKLTNEESKKMIEHFEKLLKPISEFGGKGIDLPGGRRIIIDKHKSVYSTVPTLTKPDLRRESAVEMKTPTKKELSALISLLKTLLKSTHAAEIMLETRFNEHRHIRELAILDNKSNLDKTKYTLWAAGRRARTAVYRYIDLFFTSFTEIISYSELTISHGIAFAEKAAKLYN